LGKPENSPGSPLYYCVGGGGGGLGGEGHRFSYHPESHMTYLAGSHVLRSWLGIRFIQSPTSYLGVRLTVGLIVSFTVDYTVSFSVS
jgi:hypothetical protein